MIGVPLCAHCRRPADSGGIFEADIATAQVIGLGRASRGSSTETLAGASIPPEADIGGLGVMKYWGTTYVACRVNNCNGSRPCKNTIDAAIYRINVYEISDWQQYQRLRRHTNRDSPPASRAARVITP